ncbi:MAG: tRNA pseudouridine(13) synthase TruD [Gammaproteobacteria bacterium]|nr:tRNA pseudouridine(13) synthase TruD [Gammaproteobacteria bacterium]
MSGMVVFPRSAIPCGSARLRESPEDFQVWEELREEPSGSGEHVYLYVRKRNLTTEAVRQRLASHAGIPPRDVGFAGRKDRRAVTRQWFSVPVAQPPDWSVLTSEQLEVERETRGQRKLRRGGLKGNRFRIRLRDFDGNPALLEECLARLGDTGVPNYFGEQRFGRGRVNLVQASAWLAGMPAPRGPRDMLLSSARAWLFNHVLAARVVDGSWNTVLDGDALNLDGSRSFFAAGESDPQLERRCAELDLHPTGPLWGLGAAVVSGSAQALEKSVLANFAHWRAGLERRKLEMGRRALRVRVSDLDWQLRGEQVELGFFLVSGSYATVVVRELCRLQRPLD